MNEPRGDQLVRQLLAGDGGGEYAHLLLQEIFAGYPIDCVSRLIHSEQPEAIRAGAWLMSELGTNAHPLMADFAWLLDHDERDARFYGIDAVMANSGRCDGPIIAKGIMLVNDLDDAVRWQAIRLLAVVPLEDLARAIPSIPSTHVQALSDWLTMTATDTTREHDVISRLDDDDATTRRFAVAAARRISPATDVALQHASGSEDPDVRRFAEFEIQILSLR